MNVLIHWLDHAASSLKLYYTSLRKNSLIIFVATSQKFCHYLCFIAILLLKIAERTILPSVRANNEFDYHQLSSLSQYKIWVWNQVFGNFPILNAALLLFHDGFYPIDTIFVGKIANNVRHLFKIWLFLHNIRHFPNTLHPSLHLGQLIDFEYQLAF